MSPQKRTIALVVPAFIQGGGVSTMARFLYRVIFESGHYELAIISLALSSRDAYSVRLLSPRSWFSGPRIVQDHWNETTLYHAGVLFSEFEFQRYQPRRALTTLLNQYDLVQVVSGTPAWAMIARDVIQPICLFTATTIRNERVSVIRKMTGWRRLWLRVMTEFNARIEHAALQHVTCICAESEYTRRSLMSLVPQQRLCLGVPGVDTSVFNPTSYQSDGYILTVGRFTDQRKNIRLLFEAYSQLRQIASNVPRLALVGRQAPTEQDWHYATSLQITDWIDVHKNVSLNDLAQFYHNASLFVLPSDEEGLGIVILEAMASGLPVVSTRCGGPETAVFEGETGYLTPVGDAQALAEAMQRLLVDPVLRRQMGQQGRCMVEQRFSIAAAGKIYLECYDSLLS